MNSSEKSFLDDVSFSTNEYEYLNRQSMLESEVNTQQQSVNNINSKAGIYTLWAKVFTFLIVASLLFVIALYYGVVNP